MSQVHYCCSPHLNHKLVSLIVFNKKYAQALGYSENTGHQITDNEDSAIETIKVLHLLILFLIICRKIISTAVVLV